MSDYQVKSHNSLYFELTQTGNSLDRLIYKSWFRFDAFIEMAEGSTFQIEPKGFWGTTIELKQNDQVLLKFKMNWRGEIVIQTYFEGFETDYLFKHRGLLKESYLLLDKEEKELLVMKPHIKWSNLNYEYEVTTTQSLESSRNVNILILASAHCANYYMSMIASTGV